ncbi:tail fiber assembly protein [Salmonella enterica]|nr:tail fiber assembly protein [Salmonella enterica]
MRNTALLDGNITIVTGMLTVYNYDADTGEYIGHSDEYLQEGVGIPALSTITRPPAAIDGKAIVYRDGNWIQEDDFRGQTIYNTENGAAEVQSSLGAIPAGYTRTAPSTPYDEWNGQEWLTNQKKVKQAKIDAAIQKRDGLINSVNNLINSKQWPSRLQLNRLSEEEKGDFNYYLDILEQLSSIETTAPEKIKWPVIKNI